MLEAKILEHMELRWAYLGKRGWQPRCGKAVYFKRNAPYVRANMLEAAASGEK